MQQQQQKKQPEKKVGLWPELKGKSFEEASDKIKNDRPDVKVFRVPEGTAVTMDYRMDRVRVYVDDANIVVSDPKIG